MLICAAWSIGGAAACAEGPTSGPELTTPRIPEDSPPPRPPDTSPPPHETATPPPPPEPEPSLISTRWRPLIGKIGGRYVEWGRVDDEMRWAPALCRVPQAAKARLSTSADTGTHGGKLYVLYAKDPKAYGFPPGRPLHVGSLGGSTREAPDPELEALEQILVKEAHVPVEVEGLELDGRFSNPRPAVRDGKAYLPGDVVGTFIVARVGDASTPETDAGWIYGTVLPDGSVTSAGAVPACMACHTERPNRLFGVSDR